jgi:hypothetical protein
LVDGVVVDPEDENQSATIRRFDMAPDGSQFVVDPDGDDEIASVTGMTTEFFTREDEYENLFANGRAGDEQSALGARVIRNENDEIEVAADVWTHGNRATRAARSGHFAWGVSTSQAGLDTLNGQGVSVSFAGPMSVDNRTTGSMVLNFGTQPKWTGNWANPNYNFSAGGPMSGVDLISDSSQFSANVQSGSVVQGAVLGEPGRQSIAHMIDVDLTGRGRVRDVGLLRQTGP